MYDVFEDGGGPDDGFEGVGVVGVLQCEQQWGCGCYFGVKGEFLCGVLVVGSGFWLGDVEVDSVGIDAGVAELVGDETAGGVKGGDMFCDDFYLADGGGVEEAGGVEMNSDRREGGGGEYGSGGWVGMVTVDGFDISGFEPMAPAGQVIAVREIGGWRVEVEDFGMVGQIGREVQMPEP